MKTATAIAMILGSWVKLNVFIKIMFLQCKMIFLLSVVFLVILEFYHACVIIFYSTGWILTTHQLDENLSLDLTIEQLVP